MFFDVQIFDELQPLLSEEWLALFGRQPDSPELIHLAGVAGLSGFTFKNIVVRCDGMPVLSLPIFCGEYPVALTLDSPAKTIATVGARWFPQLLRPKFVAIGFLEGEWGQVGVNANASKDTIDTAWALAASAFEKLACDLKVAATALWNFTEATLTNVPNAFLKGYSQVQSQPYCALTVRYASLEGYLHSLPKNMRRYLQRVLKKSDAISIEHATTAGVYIDRMYELYLEQVARSDMSFGVQSKDYFAEVCTHVPGAEFVLFKLHGELVAFELVVEQPHLLVSKYFAMDAEVGAEYWLYFLSWLHQIEYCIQRKIPAVHLGTAAEGIKSKLGCQLTSSYVFFRHRNPICNAILNRYKNQLAYQPDSLPEREERNGEVAVKSVAVRDREPRQSAARRKPIRRGRV